MAAGSRLALSTTIVAVDALGPRLDYLFVHNPNALTVVYINRWHTDPGSIAGLVAGNRSGGPWAVGGGATLIVPMDMNTPRGAVGLSASTGTDITGAPAAALEVVPHWAE